MSFDAVGDDTLQYDLITAHYHLIFDTCFFFLDFMTEAT